MLLKALTITVPNARPDELPNERQKNLILDGAALAFWKWYSAHQDDVVLTVLGFVKVRLRQLLPVLEKIFGPRQSFISNTESWP